MTPADLSRSPGSNRLATATSPYLRQHADNPVHWQQRLWPTEEFELARSRIPVTLPETDLFAGIQP